MYDFCFAPFYCVLLLICGAVAFAGSSNSLLPGSGIASAGLIALLTYTSYCQGYAKKKTCAPAVFGQLTVSVAATATLYQTFQGRLKQGTYGVGPGIAAFLSGLMVAYYLWNLATGPVPHAKTGPAHSVAKKDKAQ